MSKSATKVLPAVVLLILGLVVCYVALQLRLRGPWMLPIGVVNLVTPRLYGLFGEFLDHDLVLRTRLLGGSSLVVLIVVNVLGLGL